MDLSDTLKIADLLGIPRCVSDVYESRKDLPNALLAMAKQWARDRSKDPGTQVGAVVYDVKTGASFLGYNGFNSGMPDFKEIWNNRNRESERCKYKFVRHAEANAIEKATKLLGHLHDRSVILVLTHYPCGDCMMDHIVPAGIKVVFYWDPHDFDPRTSMLAAIHHVSLIKLEG